MVDYKVQLEVFEGPLDLLLYLIKKEEVDIYEVNLTKIATQFIEYVEMMRRMDLDIAGEFVVMAATLMYIKSRELLPVDQQVKVEGDEEELDPRWDLIRQLVEYKKFKDMAARLQERETTQEQIYPRVPPKTDLPEPEDSRNDVSLFDLLNAVSAILKRHQQKEDAPVITEERWSVSEKIALLREMLQERPVVRFSEFFAGARSRSEVIATFLAMLELIRLHFLAASQSEAFGEIEITRAPARPAVPVTDQQPDQAAGTASANPPSDATKATAVEASTPQEEPIATEAPQPPVEDDSQRTE